MTRVPRAPSPSPPVWSKLVPASVCKALPLCLGVKRLSGGFPLFAGQASVISLTPLVSQTQWGSHLAAF